jgi:hypothetical protein
MATLLGKNYTKQFSNVPSEKIDKGEQFGDVHVAYDSYTMSAALADGDIIKMMKLPKGAKVVDAILKTDKSLGATGILDCGYQANGVDAEDLNAFINQADGGGQALAARPTAGAAGLFKTFTAETQVVLDCTELSVATDAVIELAIFYVIN